MKTLLHKFVAGECSRQEIGELVEYFKTHHIDEEFPEVDEILQQMNEEQETDQETIDRLFDYFKSSVRELKPGKEKSHMRQLWQFARVAAILICVLGVGFYLKQEQTAISPTAFNSSSNVVTLRFENGEENILTGTGSFELKDENGNVLGQKSGDSLVYKNERQDKPVNNTLIVPNGKMFQLVLSDGTRVHLNSGSSITYPVAFASTQKRTVHLEGEAFFEVMKNDMPFEVVSNNLKVRVLGTRFNIASYKEDHETHVVLVEGSVKLYTETMDPTEGIILKPGFKGSLKDGSDAVTTEPVNTKNYTSWREGELVFRNMTFNSILKKMERHYNLTVVNENLEISDHLFNASFGNVPIETILENFRETYGINFIIDGERVTILPSKTQ